MLLRMCRSGLLAADEISACGSSTISGQASGTHGVSMVVDTGWGAIMQYQTQFVLPAPPRRQTEV